MAAFPANRPATAFRAGIKVAAAFFEPASGEQMLDRGEDGLLGGRGIASSQLKERVQVNGLPLQHIEEFEEPSLSFIHSNPYGENRDPDAHRRLSPTP